MGPGSLPATPNASYWLLVQPLIPGSGGGASWTYWCSYKSQDMVLLRLFFFFHLYNGLRLSNKAERLFTHAQNSLLSSDRPVRQQTTTQIRIFNVSLTSLMFVSFSGVYNSTPLNKVPSSIPLIHSCTNLLHSVTDRQAGTDTEELRLQLLGLDAL